VGSRAKSLYKGVFRNSSSHTLMPGVSRLKTGYYGYLKLACRYLRTCTYLLKICTNDKPCSNITFTDADPKRFRWWYTAIHTNSLLDTVHRLWFIIPQHFENRIYSCLQVEKKWKSILIWWASQSVVGLSLHFWIQWQSLNGISIHFKSFCNKHLYWNSNEWYITLQCSTGKEMNLPTGITQVNFVNHSWIRMILDVFTFGIVKD
jgi:hypothetical protein